MTTCEEQPTEPIKGNATGAMARDPEGLQIDVNADALQLSPETR